MRPNVWAGPLVAWLVLFVVCVLLRLAVWIGTGS